MADLECIIKYRDSIHVIASEYGIFDVAIFGSIARGDQTIGSDVDFLVSMRKGFDLFDKYSFQSKMETLLKCNVDVVTRRSVHHLLKDRISNEAIAL